MAEFDFGDAFKNIFYAGIGAAAMTGEAAKDLIDKMVANGELTVERGRDLTAGLADKAAAAGSSVRDGALEARMSVMSADERQAFADKAAELVDKLAARDAQRAAEQAVAAAEQAAAEAQASGEEPIEVEPLVEDAAEAAEQPADGAPQA